MKEKQPDAAMADGSPIDQQQQIDAPVAPRCTPGAAFGAPVALTTLNSNGNDWGASLSRDELTVYLSTNRLGSFDIYRATRADRSAPFGTPVALPLNTANVEVWPWLSDDELTLYVAAGCVTAGCDLYAATRATKTAEFGTPGPIANVSTAGDEGQGKVSADGSTLYWVTDRSGNYDLYRAVKDSSGMFVSPTPVTELNSTAFETGFALTRDHLGIYFGSSRTPTLGGVDMYYASRSSTAQPFGNIVKLDSLNSSVGEGPEWVSDDGCVLIFQSDRPNGGGTMSNLWMATRM